MTTLEVQRRLKALGYDPGPLDGIRGRLTIRAVKAFQSDRGLTDDGIVGPKTSAALGDRGLSHLQPSPAPGYAGAKPPLRQGEWGEGLLPWYDEALRLKGLREAAGGADNPLILRWAKELALAYAHDSTAWCGLFVAHCMAAALPEEPLPLNPLGARRWLNFGTAVEPALGAVLVFWRGARAGWQGHVGFYAGEDTRAYHVLGGNQSDSVSIARLAKERLLGARWPKTAPAPTTGAALRAPTESLSTNEA
jgi:uncharacterized protein (TIGR02594 family)